MTYLEAKLVLEQPTAKPSFINLVIESVVMLLIAYLLFVLVGS